MKDVCEIEIFSTLEETFLSISCENNVVRSWQSIACSVNCVKNGSQFCMVDLFYSENNQKSSLGYKKLSVKTSNNYC